MVNKRFAISSAEGTCGGGSECGNRIIGANFYIVYHSNYGSILLSFQDETDNGLTTD